LIFSHSPLQAQPQQSLVPGGIASIVLDENDASGYRFRNRPVLVARIDGKTRALVGLPLSLAPGEHFIEKRSDDQVRKKYFKVQPKTYSTQHITLQDKRKVFV